MKVMPYLYIVSLLIFRAVAFRNGTEKGAIRILLDRILSPDPPATAPGAFSKPLRAAILNLPFSRICYFGTPQEYNESSGVAPTTVRSVIDLEKDGLENFLGVNITR